MNTSPFASSTPTGPSSHSTNPSYVPVQQAVAPVQQAVAPIQPPAVPVQQPAVPVQQAAAPAPAGTAQPSALHPAPVLSGRRLIMTYGTQGTATHALDGVDLDIGRADSLAVMGPSGCGKTTLLHILAGILRPTSGNVLHDGTDLASLGDRARTRLRRSDFGFVFQDGQLLPELTAVENVILPRMLAGVSRRSATAEARSWLDRLGLQGMHERRPTQLSGGQAQRVSIARALAGRPSVVFADEPGPTPGSWTRGVITQRSAA
uniref:ABC transporter ATP-binding protein n=1 Tax=Brachybacterium sp. FME24 TaxID=2742605 RepID=UPI00351C8EBB